MTTLPTKTPLFEKWAFIQPDAMRLSDGYLIGILNFLKDYPNIILDSFPPNERKIRRFANLAGLITYGIPPKRMIAQANDINQRQLPALAITMRDVAPPNFATAYINPFKTAEAVVEKFTQRHCRSYCFCAPHDPFLGEETSCLLQAYRQTVHYRTGLTTHFLKAPVTTNMDIISNEAARFVKWFGCIPRPCGMFVHGDGVAKRIIDLCRIRGIEIPRDIRLISTGDSPLLCDRTVPTLSSCAINHEQVGCAAAHALYKMIHASATPRKSSFAIPLLDIIERASTRDDNGAGRIVDLVRHHIREAVDRGYAPTIRDLSQHFNVSRTKLQEDFHRTVGHTLHDELATYRLEKLANLLKASCEPAKLLLPRVGFTSISQAKRAFRAYFGVTMTDYRHGCQTRGEDVAGTESKMNRMRRPRLSSTRAAHDAGRSDAGRGFVK